jgi:3-hydroxymyristoyl/3-hydroxydecanoyl-(acyl carrier protein) dehydratase
LSTVFGFFPAAALADQRGLPATAEQRAAIESAASPRVAEPRPAIDAEPLLPSGRLSLIDEIVEFAPEGGRAHLGRAVGVQRVDPNAWYFKAHFFEDPVQPGSLGLEALLALFKEAVKRKGLHQRFRRPRFEAPASGLPFKWTYRGQIVPRSKLAISEVELTEISTDGADVLARCQASLWVDGLRIYEVKDLALRIKESQAHRAAEAASLSDRVVRLDPASAAWLFDHRPTQTAPVFPMMGVAGLLLDAPDRGTRAAAIENLELSTWIRLDQGPVEIAFKSTPLEAGRGGLQIHLRSDSVGERRLGRATLRLEEHFPDAPVAWRPEQPVELVEDPYGSGGLFHDGAFQVVERIERGARGSRFSFDIGEALRRAGSDPTILLDALFHGIPHFSPRLWFGPEAAGGSCFPYRLDSFVLYQELPRDGTLTVITRAVDMPTPRTARFSIQGLQHGCVVLDATMTEAIVPTGAFDQIPPDLRRAFAHGRHTDPQWGLASRAAGVTRLTVEAVRKVSWLPGTLETIYGLAASRDIKAIVEAVAIKEHVGPPRGIHPSRVRLDEGTITLPDGEQLQRASLASRWLDDATFEVRGS